MLVMQVSKHPADLCPAYNDKYRALTVGWYENIEPISAKHGVKFLGSYDDHAAHTVFAMFDTPQHGQSHEGVRRTRSERPCLSARAGCSRCMITRPHWP